MNTITVPVSRLPLDGIVPAMSPRQARAITDRIKSRVGEVCAMLYQAHRGMAWKALGHASWNDYVVAEFQMSKSRSFQLLSFVEVRKTLADVDGIDLMPATERQVRPLVLLPDHQQPMAWRAAVEGAGGGQPTALQVEAAVQSIRSPAGVPNPGAQSTMVDSSAPMKLPKYIPADALQYAELAILNLEKIQPNDTQRDAAFSRVVGWLFAHRGGSLAEIVRFDEIIENARGEQFFGQPLEKLRKAAKPRRRKGAL